MPDKTTVTERGQTAIPARLRKTYRVTPGTQLVWEESGDDEWRVRIERRPSTEPDPRAVRGFAKQFRATRSTAEWMRELRAGEAAAASETSSDEASDQKER